MSHLDGTCNPETCYSCKVLSVGIAASSMPTRHPQAVGDEARERRWSKDMPAYSRLKKDGVQPRSIDGSADLEARATDKVEIDYGLASTKRGLKQAKQLIADMGQ